MFVKDSSTRKSGQIASLKGSNCPYCDTFLAGKVRAAYDRAVAESNNFVAVPTMGALVEGWLLIVPKRHILSLAQLTPCEKAELTAFVNNVSAGIKRAWNIAPTMFEHGPAEEGDALGCGVDHAHLHIVPLSFSLGDAIAKFEGACSADWPILRSQYALPIPNNQRAGYLAYQEPGSRPHIASPAWSVSQFFRRVIASYLGWGECYDYRANPLEECAERTIAAYSKASVTVASVV